MIRGEAASTRCKAPTESVSGALSNGKDGLFHLRYIENRPLEPGYSARAAREYISERLNHRITFSKENIPVRITHKSYTLRRALTLTSTDRKCTRDKRPTPDCVYEEMQCTS